MAALIYAAKSDNCPFEVALVTGDNPDAPGLVIAEAEGVAVSRLARPASKDRSQFFEALDSELRSADVDTIALAGFMRILPAEFIARWDGRIVNIHPSLLPKYKGLDTHGQAIEAGDRFAGCSVHLVTEAVDDGPVIGQTPVAILTGDTPDILAERVLIAEHELYPRILAQFAARERSAEWITDKVGELALALPETRAKTSHGSPGWRVGSEASGKFFAIMFNRHHGVDSIGVLVKCSGQDEMAQLIDGDPETYFRPAYYGPSDWVGIRLDRRGVDWAHVADWLAKSWRIVAPPRLTKLSRAAAEF